METLKTYKTEKVLIPISDGVARRIKEIMNFRKKAKQELIERFQAGKISEIEYTHQLLLLNGV